MYNPPPPDIPVVVPRNSRLPGGGPILAICCILCILFIIAAVIVLALIPVYVSRSSGSTSSIPTYQYVIGTNTSLSATGYAALAIQIEKALGLPLGSVTVISATQTSSGKRKRREFVSTRRVRRSAPSYAYIITGTCRSTSVAVQALVSAGGGCNTATSGGTTCAIGSSLASTSNPANACGTTTTTAATGNRGS